MKASMEQFVESLRVSGILSPEDLIHLDEDLTPFKPSDDGRKAADILVQQKKLTPYQAMVMGTVDYLAPEQALDSKLVDGRADLYSLGYTLYFLLTGKKPYTGDSLMQIMMAHQQREIPSLRELRPDVTQRLEAIYIKMVAKNREDRFTTMTALIDALQLLDAEPITDDASSLSVVPAEDLARQNFQKFLNGLDVENTPTITMPRVAVLPEPSRGDAPSSDKESKETTGSTGSAALTDTGPKKRSHRKLIAGVSLAALSLLIIGLWPSGGGNKESNSGENTANTTVSAPDSSRGNDIQASANQTTSSTNNGQPAAKGDNTAVVQQQSSDYALSFDGGSVLLPEMREFNGQAITLEATSSESCDTPP